MIFMLVLYPRVLVKLEFGDFFVCGGNETPEDNPTTNSTHIWHPAGIEPGRH